MKEWQGLHSYQLFPAKPSELVVLALVMLKEPLSGSRIVQWVMDAFKIPPIEDDYDFRAKLRLEMRNSFKDFVLPVDEGMTSDFDMKWKTCIRSANLYLRRRLFPIVAPDDHFPFMKVSVEIRESIFRLLSYSHLLASVTGSLQLQTQRRLIM